MKPCPPEGAAPPAHNSDSVAAETLTGDLAPLVAALAQPDDGRWLGPCTADMELSGCASEWTAPFDKGTMLSIPSIGSFPSTDAVSPIPSAPLTATAPTEVDGMLWCRYSVEPDRLGGQESSETAAVPGSITLRTGHFVAGGTLDTATAQLVAGVAASESIPHSCDASAAMFLVLWPKRGREELGITFTAELDGCQMLYGDRSGARPLPADVRERLIAQAAIGG